MSSAADSPLARLRPALWGEAEGMRISRTDDGNVVADRFPDVVIVADELERRATGPLIRRARNFLILRLANGLATYELLDRRPGVSLWHRVRLSVAAAA